MTMTVRFSWEPGIRSSWVSIFAVPRAIQIKTVVAFFIKAELYSGVYFVFSWALKNSNLYWLDII